MLEVKDLQDNIKYEQLIKKATEKIKELTRQLDEKSESGDIAILGYSCRFPGGADNPEKYWELLREGYDAVIDIPKERFDVMEYYAPNRGIIGKTYTKSASFLTCDIKAFDNNHFEMSRVEATSIDPQHRLLLEVTWEALQNAGIDILKARGSKTGVYVGLISSEYGMSEVASDSPYNITPYSLMGNYINSASGRISYYFDFKGPSMAIDTACSSSLSALNEAVIALRTHQCDMAIVGGANLLLTPNGFVGLSQVEAISEDGRCRAFDSSASGYGRSEGCGVIVLKRFEDAQKNNDNIQAVIKSVSVMHGGKSNGFFAPNGVQEQAVMAQALSESGLTIDEIDYIETHGTGTVLGDAIETKAIHEVYGKRSDNLLIGSVKTNLGHMEAAAGIASIIKVLLSLKNSQIPENIHYKNPNKECVYPRLKVVDKLIDWKRRDKLRAAGISSFGISGTLSHMIIQEYDNKEKSESPEYEDIGRLVTFSALTKKALEAYLKDISEKLNKEYKNLNIKNLSFISNRTRSSLNCRFASVVHSIHELKDILEEINNDKSKMDKFYGDRTVNIDDCRIVFVPFEKEILDKNADIKQIMATSEAFKKTIIDFDNRYRELGQVSIFDKIYGHTIPEERKCDVILQLALHVAYYRMLNAALPEFGSYSAKGIGKLALEYIKGKISFENITAISVAIENDDIERLKKEIEIAGIRTDLSVEECLEISNRIYSADNDAISEITEKDMPQWKATVVIGGCVKTKKTVVFNGDKGNYISALKELYLLGLSINWNRIDDVFLYPIDEQPILPGYYFDRKTCWKNPVFFGGVSSMEKTQKLAIEEDEKKVTIDNLKNILTTQAASVSGLEPEDIETDRSLTVYGFESISFFKIANLLNQHFSVQVEPKDFYDKLNSIDNICKFVVENCEQIIGDDNVSEEIVFHGVDRDYPMSTMQARIYSECEMNDKKLYDLVGAYYIDGDIDIDRLEECATKQLKRHKVLSTGLFMNHGEFCMRYCDSCRISIRTVTQMDDSHISEFIRDNLIEFDMEKPPLMEILNIRTFDERNLMVFHFHHTVADGVSMNLYASEIFRMYYGETLSDTKSQYWDYSIAENLYFDSEAYTNSKNFWINSLKDVIFKLPLPFDFMNDGHDVSGASVLSVIGNEQVRKIRSFCADNSATPFMFFQACIGLLLHRLTFEDHIAIAVPVSCRSKNFMESIGMFTNTVAVCSHYDRNISFKEMLANVSAYNSEFMNNIAYPFNHLSEELGLSRNNTLNVMYVYENTNARSSFGKVAILVPCNYESDKEPFDLNFELMEHDGVVDIHLRYKTSLFKKNTVERIASMLDDIVSNVLNEPEKSVGSMDLLNDVEKAFISKYSIGEKLVYKKSTIPEMFNEQAEKYADSIAVLDENDKITYAELKTKAVHIACALKNKGICHGDIVALSLNPGIEMICTILGVLYAGAVYLPIATDCPQERLDYILSDSGAVMLIENTNVDTMACQTTTVSSLEECSVDVELSPVKPEDLAYVIYTSGTTGKPKGVMVEHSGVANLREYFRHTQGVDKKDRALQFASYAFDASLSEFAMTILSGGTLYVVPYEYRKDMEKLAEYIKENKITICVLPPVVLQQLPVEKLSSLRTIITAGSETTKSIVEKYSDIGVYSNDYGPTETTVCATYWKHLKGEPVPERVPIGRPMCNKQIYILNGESLCGPGIKGELCIAGDGIARGYLGMPRLTAEKFTDCPFTEGKMYRTGDVARWLSDGNIEYLGRIDNQIKLRGYRIELDEIEVIANSMLKIKSCVAKLMKNGANDEEIVLYYVIDKEVGNGEIESGEIRRYMKSKLPEYMIPSYFISIDEIPLNCNGKVDMGRLPSLEERVERTYIEPANNIEKIICGIMEEILKNDLVGATDDFFEIGGNSLKAMALSNRISEAFNCKVTYRKIYEFSTPRMLAELIEKGESEKLEEMLPISEQPYYDLAYAQKRIYSITNMQPEGTAYNMPQILCFKGEIDAKRIKSVIQEIVDAHSVLRSFYSIIDGEPKQLILSELKVEIQEITDTGEDVQMQMQKFVRPFELSKAPLFRIALMESNNCTYMFADFHHIICDGMSLLNFSNEFVERYNGAEIESQKLQYVDYCQWMNSRDFSSQAKYWQKEFEEFPDTLSIPEDFARPKEMTYNGATVSVEMNMESTDKIEKYAKKNGFTPYVIFLSSLMVLLQRYSGSESDVVIGSPVSGRTRRETEKMLGMFVNTIAMRGRPTREISFYQFLKEMNDKCINAYENQEYPFDRLVSDLSLGGDMSRNPLFDVMLAFQNNEQCEKEIKDIVVETISYEGRIAKFDLTWNIEKRNSVYNIVLEYNTDIFKKETIERLIWHFEYLIEQLLTQPNKKIGEFALILPEEKQILDEMNRTDIEIPNDTIPVLFEKKVNIRGEADAIVYGDQRISYKRLDEVTNAFSRKLYDEGIRKGDFVAIMADRSIEFFAGVLSILKTGAAYVPIDPLLPSERIQYILSDCQPKKILTFTKEDIIQDVADVIKLKPIEEWETSTDKLDVQIDVHDIAYCIYTSGTTGRPKGVLLEHIGVVTLREYFSTKQDIGEADHTLQFANYSFDASVSEMTMGILTGACMYILPDDIRNNFEKLREFIVCNHITIAILPPQYVRNVDVAGMRLIITAGSESAPDVVAHCASADVYSNDYGPTEVTVCATYWKHLADEPMPFKIPIGKPICNKQVYIMNDMTLCGCNIPGELCIGGIGLARGYLGKPELTASKFVINPYTGTSMYRTGDLARMLPDGNIEFLGRIDNQVKIRGYRVELGEIEQVIKGYEGTKDCAIVFHKERGEVQDISAYVVLKENTTGEEVKEHVKKHLPEYMIPKFYIFVDEIPYNRSGKVDFALLPRVKSDSKEYEAPQNELEEKICHVFEDVLMVKKVGRNDSFFELGGDSIKAISIVSKLGTLGYQLSYHDMMLYKTVAGIIPYIKVGYIDTYGQEQVTGMVRDTPMLHMFKKWKLKKPSHFNQSIVLKFDTDCEEEIEQALPILCRHHDVLRAVYKDDSLYIREKDCGRQLELYSYRLTDSDMIQQSIVERCGIIQKTFELNQGPLFKTAYFRTTEGYYLLLCMHHLIVDRLSWTFIIEDLQSCIQQISMGKKPQLNDKTASILHWEKYLKEYVETEQCRMQRKYWESVVNKVKQWRFPVDSNIMVEGRKNVDIVLDKVYTNTLISSCGHTFNTEVSELIIAAICTATKRTVGLDEIVLLLENNGRQELHRRLNLAHSVGWFTNTYPVVISCDGELKDVIISTKDALRDVPDGGMAFSMCFADECNVRTCMSFNYVGKLDTDNHYANVNSQIEQSNFAQENDFLSEIDLNGRIVDGQLCLILSYDACKHSEKMMQQFSHNIKDSLIEIISLCSNSLEIFETRSDIAEKGIEEDEFNEILNMSFE